jgi:catalase
MVPLTLLLLCVAQRTIAACPYMQSVSRFREQLAKNGRNAVTHSKRATSTSNTTSPIDTFLDQFTLNDTDVYMTNDVGGPIQDQESLKAGLGGPTLLEDFMFQQKIHHFDHERVSLIALTALRRIIATSEYSRG